MFEKKSFDSLNISIPKEFYNYNLQIQEEIYNYLCSLDEHQKIAYKISLEHLGSSFNIYRSNGFKEWITQQKNQTK